MAFNMKNHIYFISVILLLACISESIINQSPKQRTELKPTQIPSILIMEDKLSDTIGVSPICTILGKDDTREIEYGKSVELHWGWQALTEQQVNDYINNAVTTVTFHHDEIKDATQGDIYESGGINFVLWWKELGVLGRGKYEMTYYVEFKAIIFDGWEYYGPETNNVTINDKCYLIIK
jgi:hypothetical protein